MKLLLAGAAALVLGITSPSFAEDLKPADQWAGGYIGVHGGYAKANRNGCADIGINLLTYDLLPAPDPIDSCDGAGPEYLYDYDQKGILVGVQGGYNWEPFDSFLVGVELNASLGNVKGEVDGPFGGVGAWTSLVTATAKAGFTADRFLVYGEGGVAMAGSKFEGDLGCAFGSASYGPVAGAGVSVKISNNASIDLKYNHVWLGGAQSNCNSTATFLDPDFLNVPTQFLTQGGADVVKVGINFQLGG